MSQLAALFLPPWQPLADQLLRVWSAMGLRASIAGVPIADRAAVLAEQLFALGVRDLSRLSIGSVTRYTGADSRAPAGALVDWSQYRGAPTKTYSFLAYEGEPIGYLSTDGGASVESDPYDPTAAGVLDLWDPAGSGHIKWQPLALPSGVIIFNPVWASSSDVPVEVIAMLSITAAFAGLPAIIGEAVLGASTAAAYPAAAQVLGNVAMQAALTGGDIETAARSAAASFAGGQFGDVVGSGLDSAAIGKVTAAATTAALRGGDVEKAVLRSLVDIGARAMDEEFTFGPGDPVVDYGTGDWDPSLMEYVTLEDLGVDSSTVDTSNILADNTDSLVSQGVDIDYLSPDAYGNLFLSSGEFVSLTSAAFVDSIYVDSDGNIRAPDNSIMIPSDEALNATVDQLSAEIARQMDAAAGTVETSQPAPPSRPAAIPPAASQTKWPSISDVTKLLDAVGKLSAQLKATTTAIKTGTYRPPTGGTSTVGTPRNTPVGVPVTLPDGRVVVNNGNGTQTIRNPDGTTTTVSSSYSGASGAAGGLLPGVSNQALLIGGAVLLGAVLLARRR